MVMESEERKFQIIDLSPYFNNDGISYALNRADGGFDTWGSCTYPAEELPESNLKFICQGVEFLFPDKSDGQNNNLALEKQNIKVPAKSYEVINILGASEEGHFEEEITLEYSDGSLEKVSLGLSDWGRTYKFAKYKEKVGIRCSRLHGPKSDREDVKPTIWLQKIVLNSSKKLTHIRLVDNPCMHIFALTLTISKKDKRLN